MPTMARYKLKRMSESNSAEAKEELATRIEELTTHIRAQDELINDLQQLLLGAGIGVEIGEDMTVYMMGDADEEP